MRKMPLSLRKELQRDPFYQKCCITGYSNKFVKIDFHHNFIFAGRQVNEKWCILPLGSLVHIHIVQFKEQCDWIMLNRADEETLKKYSKAVNLIRERDRLNKKYGKYEVHS